MRNRLKLSPLGCGPVLSLFVAAAASAADPTALQLVKEGNQYVSVEARDKVVEIKSEKSVGGLTPSIWRVIYFDADAMFDATEVKFGAGQKLDVNRPFRPIQKIKGSEEHLDRSRLKIDSDRAIEIALKEPLLENLTVKATRVEMKRAGGDAEADRNLPVWKVELWVAKLSKPGKEARLGQVILSADDGTVLKSDLKPSRVD